MDENVENTYISNNHALYFKCLMIDLFIAPKQNWGKNKVEERTETLE